MRAIGIVAVNTFREAVRDRVLYSLVLFALLMFTAAILVGQISIGIENIVIVSLGLSTISLMGLLMAVFIGVGLVYKEMDKRTLYALLSKPVRRSEFLLGKYAGLVLTLGVNTLFMTLGLFAAMLYVKHGLTAGDVATVIAAYFILLKLALVVALALLFSCFTTPLLAILFTAGLYVTGLFAHQIRTFRNITGSAALDALAVRLSYLLPNFENYNAIAAAAHGRAIPAALVLQNTAYTAVYGAVILLAASFVFSRRNLK
jgi:ABC-type transport system involved in multi-copper enzyme maturation permease subunit